MQQHRSPVYSFPPVETADDNGLLAYGGDLAPERLIAAYESGIFPWFDADQPILWWSPPKRMVLIPGQMRISKSLKQTINRHTFNITIDRQFGEVIRHCASTKRKSQAGTWISKDMIAAYETLHEMGFAHSFESWFDGKLVGGLYGVSLGSAFFGESMFSEVSNASKVAFHSLHQFTLDHHFTMIDCQLHTSHLESLGAKEMHRTQFMNLLHTALGQTDLRGKWTTAK